MTVPMSGSVFGNARDADSVARASGRVFTSAS